MLSEAEPRTLRLLTAAGLGLQSLSSMRESVWKLSGGKGRRPAAGAGERSPDSTAAVQVAGRRNTACLLSLLSTL